MENTKQTSWSNFRPLTLSGNHLQNLEVQPVFLTNQVLHLHLVKNFLRPQGPQTGWGAQFFGNKYLKVKPVLVVLLLLIYLYTRNTRTCMICFARRCHHCKWSSCFVWFSIGLNEIPSLCKSYPAKHALSCIFMPFMTWDQPWPSRSLAWCDMCSHQLIHDGLSWPTKHPTVSLIFSNNLLGRKKNTPNCIGGVIVQWFGCTNGLESVSTFLPNMYVEKMKWRWMEHQSPRTYFQNLMVRWHFACVFETANFTCTVYLVRSFSANQRWKFQRTYQTTKTGCVYIRKTETHPCGGKPHLSCATYCRPFVFFHVIFSLNMFVESFPHPGFSLFRKTPFCWCEVGVMHEHDFSKSGTNTKQKQPHHTI